MTDFLVIITADGTKGKTLNRLGESPCDVTASEKGSRYCIDYCQGSCWERHDVEFEDWEKAEAEREEFDIDFDRLYRFVATAMNENKVRYGLNISYPSGIRRARLLKNGKIAILP